MTENINNNNNNISNNNNNTNNNITPTNDINNNDDLESDIKKYNQYLKLCDFYFDRSMLPPLNNIIDVFFEKSSDQKYTLNALAPIPYPTNGKLPRPPVGHSIVDPNVTKHYLYHIIPHFDLNRYMNPISISHYCYHQLKSCQSFHYLFNKCQLILFQKYKNQEIEYEELKIKIDEIYHILHMEFKKLSQQPPQN